MEGTKARIIRTRFFQLNMLANDLNYIDTTQQIIDELLRDHVLSVSTLRRSAPRSFAALPRMGDWPGATASGGP